MVRNLEVEHEYLREDESKNLRVFRRCSTTKSFATFDAADFKEKTTRSFVDHINACLKDHDRRLTDEAVQKLSDYTGEIIANAEDHSGNYDWSIIGYLDNDADSHMCEINIFNFGKSISETFRSLKSDAYIMTQISPYLEAHRKKSFFSPGWNEDDLLTLVALQGHISSKNLNMHDDRGQGTVDLINFFQKVHSECTCEKNSSARMAILSGSTFILFDGKYMMEADARGRQIIAFNDTNDLNDAPDKKYVYNIDNHFPGTLIAIRFQLQINSQTEEVL